MWRVTVFIRTYNQCEYVAQAINSALSQVTSFDFKILIQDDASTDGTREIIEEYVKKFPNIIHAILLQENKFSQGIQPSFMGWPLFDTEYVAFLDGDDLWTSVNKLQKQVDLLDLNSSYSMCQTLTRYWDSRADMEISIFPPRQRRTFKANIYDLALGNFVQTSAVMFRLSSLPELPEDFNDLPFSDYAIFTLLAMKGPIGLIDEVMVCYRANIGYWTALSQLKREEKTLEVKEYLIKKIPKPNQKVWLATMQGERIPVDIRISRWLRRKSYEIFGKQK